MDLLQERNKTTSDVAKALGVSARTVQHWLAGTRQPRLTLSQVKSLCELLNCAIAELPDSFSPQQKKGADIVDASSTIQGDESDPLSPSFL